MTKTITIINPAFANQSPYEIFGLVPDMLIDTDARNASAQFQQRYSHGGGWRPQDGFTNKPAKNGTPELHYEGDEPLKPIALLTFREERIYIFVDAFVAIFQPNDSFEICRMD